MIIVLGHIVVKEDMLEEALALSQRHVTRSRGESGCITHGVHIDSENPQRLVFVEKWRDHASLSAHFKQSGSLEFMRALEGLLVEAPEMSIYQANQAKPHATH